MKTTVTVKGPIRLPREIVDSDGRRRRVEHEHPAVVRFTHWALAIALPVMILSGLEIFRAFPSFGPKIPEDLLWVAPRWATLGDWLGGALRWHFTFMWLFAGAGIVYLVYQVASGNIRQILPTRRDLRGVVPMIRHYFAGAPEPPYSGPYNPLQKLAYLSIVACGLLASTTGLALYKPVQFWWLLATFGGFRTTRVLHFAATLGFLLFIPGHLLMVGLHGWNNFRSMVVGWKLGPAGTPADRRPDPVDG
jgi:thiosulfate reductase cytochrome b subunit